MASLGATALDLMTSEISRFMAMSSLGDGQRASGGECRGARGHTGCCWWPFQSVRRGPCWPRTTTSSSSWQPAAPRRGGPGARRWRPRQAEAVPGLAGRHAVGAAADMGSVRAAGAGDGSWRGSGQESKTRDGGEEGPRRRGILAAKSRWVEGSRGRGVEGSRGEEARRRGVEEARRREGEGSRRRGGERSRGREAEGGEESPSRRVEESPGRGVKESRMAGSVAGGMLVSQGSVVDSASQCREVASVCFGSAICCGGGAEPKRPGTALGRALAASRWRAPTWHLGADGTVRGRRYLAAACAAGSYLAGRAVLTALAAQHALVQHSLQAPSTGTL